MKTFNTIAKIYLLSSIISILLILFFPNIIDNLIYPTEKKTNEKSQHINTRDKNYTSGFKYSNF
jgi:hypothetical protein